MEFVSFSFPFEIFTFFCTVHTPAALNSKKNERQNCGEYASSIWQHWFRVRRPTTAAEQVVANPRGRNASQNEHVQKFDEFYQVSTLPMLFLDTCKYKNQKSCKEWSKKLRINIKWTGSILYFLLAFKTNDLAGFQFNGNESAQTIYCGYLWLISIVIGMFAILFIISLVSASVASNY